MKLLQAPRITTLLLFLTIQTIFFINDVRANESKPKATYGFEDQASSVRLISSANHLLIECRLNDKRAFFLLDTGASYSVLNSKYKKKYKFDVVKNRFKKRLNSSSFGGRNSPDIAINAILKIGKVLVARGFLSQDIHVIAETVTEETGFPIIGIIGSDLLKMYRATIDLNENKLSLKTNQ